MRRKLRIRREGNGVDEVFDIGQGLTVERRDSVREAIDEVFELIVWDGTIDIAVPLGEFAIEVLAPQQDLQRPAPSEQTRQPRRWMASRKKSEADFRLTEHGPLSAGEADVGGEHKFTAGAAGEPADR